MEKLAEHVFCIYLYIVLKVDHIKIERNLFIFNIYFEILLLLYVTKVVH